MPARRTPAGFAASPFRRRRRKGSVRRTGTSDRKRAYLEYMRSPAWRAFRAAWWQRYDGSHEVRRCWCCGKAQAELAGPLELHHLTYEHLGQERYEDCVAVCAGRGGCHPWITRRQRSRSTTMSIREITEARRKMMTTYMEKRNGPASGR